MFLHGGQIKLTFDSVHWVNVSISKASMEKSLKRVVAISCGYSRSLTSVAFKGSADIGNQKWAQ